MVDLIELSESELCLAEFSLSRGRFRNMVMFLGGFGRTLSFLLDDRGLHAGHSRDHIWRDPDRKAAWATIPIDRLDNCQRTYEEPLVFSLGTGAIRRLLRRGASYQSVNVWLNSEAITIENQSAQISCRRVEPRRLDRSMFTPPTFRRHFGTFTFQFDRPWRNFIDFARAVMAETLRVGFEDKKLVAGFGSRDRVKIEFGGEFQGKAPSVSFEYALKDLQRWGTPFSPIKESYGLVVSIHKEGMLAIRTREGMIVTEHLLPRVITRRDIYKTEGASE